MFREPKSVEWKEFPEYDSLALRMAVSLSPRRRWGVARFGGISRTNALRGEVIFDSKSFFKLSEEERLAVTAHELAHIKSRHSLYAGLILSCGAVVAIASAFEGSIFLPTVTWLVFYLAMVYYRRHGEYQADLVAIRYVPVSSLISALGRFRWGTRRYERVAGGLTHPPIDARTERLRRLGIPS